MSRCGQDPQFRSRINAPGEPPEHDAEGPYQPVQIKSRRRSVRLVLLKIVVCSLLAASPFLVLAAVYWSSPETREIHLYLAGCLAIAGALLVIGFEINRKYGAPTPPATLTETGKDVAVHVAQKLIPDPAGIFYSVGKMLLWLVRKDFRTHEQGRAKRVVLGATVVAMVAVIGCVVLLTLSNVFAGNSVPQNCLLLFGVVVGGTVLGGFLGGISDSL